MLNSAFSKVFPGIIWRIKADEENKWIAVESRDPENGIPEFSVIHYPTGRILFDQLRYGDRWWTIAGIAKGYLLLQALREQGPQAEGLVAIECETGQIAWEAFHYRLLSLTAEGALVSHRNLSGTSGDLIDVASGNLIASRIQQSAVKPSVTQVVLPVVYEGERPSRLDTYAMEGPLFYNHYGKLDLWSFHERAETGYSVRLVTFSGQSAVHNQTIIGSTEKMLLEPFFLLDDQVFCVQYNNREIASYFLKLTEQHHEL